MKTLLPHAMKIRFLIGVALCFVQSAVVNAQVLDTRFRAPVVTQRTYFEDVAELSDRKLIVAMGGGGNYYYYGTKQLQSNLVKLSSSGLLDPAFKTDFWGYAERVIEHKSGSFFVIDGWNDDDLVLLSRSGRVMEYFELYNVHDVCVLPDYSFLVSTGDALVKYKSNFEIDTNFGVDGWVTLDEDAEVNDIQYFEGKFYIAGEFWWVGDTEVNDVARLNANGSVDTSFDPGWGADDEIGSITIQPDGKILLGNTDNRWFDDEYFGGSIIRLNNDGSIDWDFETRWFEEVGDVFYTSGKILAADSYYQDIYRLELDGSDDETFEPLSVATWDGDLDLFVLKSNDFILSNTYSEEEVEFGLRKYKRNGQRVSSFKPPLSENGWISSAVPAGQKMIIAGEFQWVNGQPRSGIARLSNTGALDATFKTTQEIGGLNYATVLSDGGIVAYSNWWGQVVKFNSNGSLNEDFSYQWGQFPPYYIQEIKALPAGGFVFKVYYSNSGYIGFGVRDSDGDFIDGFADMVTNVYYWDYGYNLYDIEVQPDGKIIYASPATTFNGNGGYQKVTRFNPDGTVDNTFNVGSAYNQNYLRQVTLLQDGGLFLEGNFSQFNGYNVNGAVKLLSDGSVDTDFLSNYANGGFYYYNYDYPTIPFRNGIIKWGLANSGWGVQMMNYDGTSENMLSIGNLYIGWTPGISAGDSKTLYFYDMGNGIQVNGVNKNSAKVVFPALKPLPVQASSPARIAQNATYEVFPNPTADFIAFDTDKPAKVSIVTMDGHVKAESTVQNGDDLMDVRNLQPGRYVIRMVVDGEVRSSHFIKK